VELPAKLCRAGYTLAGHALEAGDQIVGRRVVVANLRLDDVTKLVRSHHRSEVDDGASGPRDRQPVQQHHVAVVW